MTEKDQTPRPAFDTFGKSAKILGGRKFYLELLAMTEKKGYELISVSFKGGSLMLLYPPDWWIFSTTSPLMNWGWALTCLQTYLCTQIANSRF